MRKVVILTLVTLFTCVEYSHRPLACFYQPHNLDSVVLRLWLFSQSLSALAPPVSV